MESITPRGFGWGFMVCVNQALDLDFVRLMEHSRDSSRNFSN